MGLGSALLGKLVHCREHLASEVGEFECSAPIGGDKKGATEIAFNQADLVSERPPIQVEVLRRGMEVRVPSDFDEAL